MSAPFLSPRGVTLRCTMCTACCVNCAAVIAGARPVAIGDLADHLAPLLERLKDDGDVKILSERVLDADLDVVKIYEYGDLQPFFSHNSFFHWAFRLRELDFSSLTKSRPPCLHHTPETLPVGVWWSGNLVWDLAEEKSVQTDFGGKNLEVIRLVVFVS